MISFQNFLYVPLSLESVIKELKWWPPMNLTAKGQSGQYPRQDDLSVERVKKLEWLNVYNARFSLNIGSVLFQSCSALFSPFQPTQMLLLTKSSLKFLTPEVVPNFVSKPWDRVNKSIQIAPGWIELIYWHVTDVGPSPEIDCPILVSKWPYPWRFDPCSECVNSWSKMLFTYSRILIKRGWLSGGSSDVCPLAVAWEG